MGQRLHASPAAASSASSTAACSSPAMPRTRCRRSARAAATRGVQDADNLAGSSHACCAGRRRRAAGQLRQRTRRGGGREHPELDPQHRLHHAQERGQPRLSRCRAVAGARASVRATAGQQRTPVDADHAPWEPIVVARPRCLRGRDGARRACRGRAGAGRRHAGWLLGQFGGRFDLPCSTPTSRPRGSSPPGSVRGARRPTDADRARRTDR